MKLPRTKAQELVSIFWGPGRYIVNESDVPDIVDHLRETLSPVIPGQYLEVFLKFIEGDQLTPVELQQKFHLTNILKRLVSEHPEVEPTFLTRIEYPEDKQWGLADIAMAFYGVKGDPKIYHRGLPTPHNGEFYTTEEVKRLVLTS